VVDEQFVIGVEEHQVLNCRKLNKMQKMSFAKQADNLVKQFGFKCFIGVSLLEMEYAKNEAEYLLEVFKPMFEDDKLI
jgi:Ran GTPase-activating protein (RanGAP) involved in mRNA processing and transport